MDEAHPPLDQPTGQETIAPKMFGVGIIQTVKLLGGRGFLRQVYGVRRMRLHTVSEFVRGDASRQLGILLVGFQAYLVELPDKVKPAPLVLRLDEPG